MMFNNIDTRLCQDWSTLRSLIDGYHGRLLRLYALCGIFQNIILFRIFSQILEFEPDHVKKHAIKLRSGSNFEIEDILMQLLQFLYIILLDSI